MNKIDTSSAALAADPLADATPDASHPPPHAAIAHPSSFRHDVALTIGALGVVFGDIGTSPIYATHLTIVATSGAFQTHYAVLGAI